MVTIALAIAVGIFGIGATLSAYTILDREIRRNYSDTNPATAHLELDNVSDSLVSAVRQRPGIADAEAGSTLMARIETGPGEWKPLLVFVVRDFQALRINRVWPESGAWPPPVGSILLEREGLKLLKARVGATYRVQAPNGASRIVMVSGVAHDPGLAPAWQEQTAYAYATPATLARLGESGTLHQLKVVVEDQSSDPAAAERTVRDLAGWLKQQGRSVGEIRIPPGKHPHQTQMRAVLALLFILSLMVLLLSAVLTATLIGGLLAQQTRQIGIMKAIGARTRQIAALYLGLTVLLGAAAVALGLPPGIVAGRNFAGAVAQLMNVKIYSEAVPGWVCLLQLLAGILVPLCATVIPIANTTRITVRESINDFGISREDFGSRRLDMLLGKIRGLDRTLALALRNAFRRRGRLLLTLTLLAAAGGLFMASLNVKTAWESYVAQAASQRRYDLEISLNRPAPERKILKALAGFPGVRRVEPWSLAPVAVGRTDGLEVVRTYPNGGQGSFTLRSVPAGSRMVEMPQLAGRWLQPGDTDGVVVNHLSAASFPELKVGDLINLTSGSHSFTLRVVGIVREVLSPAAAYVTPETFARAIGPAGYTNGLRLALNGSDSSTRATLEKKIEQVLLREGASPKLFYSRSMMDLAQNGHVYVFIVPLIMISTLMAVVGGLGLMSAMVTNVAERTREFGVMRTIGSRSVVVVRNVVAEGVFVGLMSWVVGWALSLPLSVSTGRLLGGMAFRAPLPLAVSPTAIAVWLGIVIAGSSVASVYPAWKASQLTIRETLTYI